MRLFAVVLLATTISIPQIAKAVLFGPSNRWECILKKMPGTANDTAATVIARSCYERFDKFDQIFVAESNRIFGPKNTSDCVEKYAKDTSSRKAGRFIYMACKNIFENHSRSFKDLLEQSKTE